MASQSSTNSMERDVLTLEAVQNIMEEQQDDGIVCDVCNTLDLSSDNQIVICEECEVAVHQDCYGVATIPEGQWLCKFCESVAKSPMGAEPKRKCVFCPQTRGALTKTEDGQWAHVACCLWIPETAIGNPITMEPAVGVKAVQPDRYEMVCSLCKWQEGAIIQCSGSACHVPFHPLCGRAVGFHMDMIEQLGREDQAVPFMAYCKKHNPDRKLRDAVEKKIFLGGGASSIKLCVTTVSEMLKRNKQLVHEIQANQTAATPSGLTLNMTLIRELNINLNKVLKIYKMMTETLNANRKAKQGATTVDGTKNITDTQASPPSTTSTPATTTSGSISTSSVLPASSELEAVLDTQFASGSAGTEPMDES
eukprot:GILK01005538.1.p1 GENE.GILK01005538.1~~GILK01005538.1.p1  ORF type:complete len:380 (-),score=44.26 GILK01005538.1:173-1267(-)